MNAVSFKKNVSILVSVLIVVFFFTRSASAAVFFRNLKLGDSGADVKALQKLLNEDPETLIARQGPGSYGEETGFFGGLTQSAVIRFQNKNAEKILVPAGLNTGTGFVGSLTRQVLEGSLQSASPSIPNPAQNIPLSQSEPTSYAVTATERTNIYVTDEKIKTIQDTVAQKINTTVAGRTSGTVIDVTKLNLQEPGDVLIQKISANQGKPGASITVSGVGLMATNNVYFGSDLIVRNVQSAGGVLYLTIPSLPSGKYDIAIRNSQGISNTVPFVVLKNSAPAVKITSVKATEVRFGDTITLTGSGFSLAGNDIVTTLGTIRNVASSDGTTLSFPFQPESLRETAKLGNGTIKISIELGVVNENGVSASNVRFTLSI